MSKNRTITQMLGDAYQMGKTDAFLKVDDHEMLMPKMVAKAKDLLLSAVPEKKLEGPNKPVPIALDYGFNQACDLIESNIRSLFDE